MDKEEALNEFLKGLRIVLNNAFAYPKEHPYFIKSVNNFKQKIDALLVFLNPVKIDVTPDSLFVDGRCWEKIALYVELASMFHLRKVRSIEFREGLTIEELIDFLSSACLSTKEILRQGGIQNILEKKGSSTYLIIQELDYSELLKGGGEEIKDIWVYLVRQAIDKKDLQKINEFADNFDKIMKKIKTKDLFEDKDLRGNLHDFLNCLKNNEKNKYYNSTRQLFKWVLKETEISQEDGLDKIRLLFQDLSKNDFTEILTEEILENENFNYLNFKIFCLLIDRDKHREIALDLGDKIKNTGLVENNPRLRKKIKEVFSGFGDSSFLPFYKHALSSIFEEPALTDTFSFDQGLVQTNYYFILLNLLTEEKDREGLRLISECLLKECDRIIQDKNLEALKFLLEVLDKRTQEDASLVPLFEGLQRLVYKFIEDTVFEEASLAGLEYLTDKLKESSLGFHFYFNKIFNENKVNPYILKLLVKFFPQKLPYVYENLEKRHSDFDFLIRIVKGLEKVDSPLGIEILKRIFYFSNTLIKREVLSSMQNLTRCDEGFLFPILKNEDSILRKEALIILARNEKTKKLALQELLYIRSPWGRRNKVIIENIMIIKEIELKEAEEYLVNLSKRSFFWNRNLREKAQEVLKNWHVRKD